MLHQKNRKRISSYFIIGILLVSANLVIINDSEAEEPFFTLVLKMRNYGTYQNMALEMALMLKDIGINLDITFLDYVDYVQELVVYKDFDIFFLSTRTDPQNPDMSDFFAEDGAMNFVNYASTLDYNETLSMGKNQWLLEEGKTFVPPNSEERIQHYWQWQEYLMTKINPALFVLTPQSYVVHWAELEGYDIEEGLLESWGKMSWKTAHTNQTSQEELVLRYYPCENMNPLFQSYEEIISSAILDPLVWCGTDNKIYSHLASTWTHINNTQVRFTIHEDIPWQPDVEGNFTMEYFTAEDVYFTFYCWQNLSNEQEDYVWIKDIQIVDDHTIDFFMDADPETPENDYYPQYLYSLAKGILPEHYLNQSQLVDGKTPDIEHESWSLFNYNKTFGTGMFEYDSFNESGYSLSTSETVLTLNPTCWLFNDSIDKTDMNFEERFGSKWSLTTLIIRYYDTCFDEAFDFLWGNIDLMDVTSYPENRTLYQSKTEFTVQNKDRGLYSFFGYNLSPNRPWIGSQELCPNDPSMTIGLAIRKAISHAIDRAEINMDIYSGEYTVNDYPLPPTAGIWLNPTIYRYNYDLTTAQEYMLKAGFSHSSTNGTNLNWYAIFGSIILCAFAHFVQRKSKKRK